MASGLETAFGGTREIAKSAASQVAQKIGAHKEPKCQLQYGLMVLRSLCVAVGKSDGKHFDIYCDILVRVLGPRMQPTANAKHWAAYLEHVRYFHHLMQERKLYSESAQVIAYIASCDQLLQNETDYKLALSLYSHHLLSQYSHMRTNATEAQRQILQVLDALTALFHTMQQLNVELNFLYVELIADFVQYLLPKRGASVYNFLCSLPPAKTRMYEAFFGLLSGMRTPAPLPHELSAHCQRHLEALAVFLQLDVVDRLSEQVALRHLRACRDMRLLQSDKSVGYVFSLLYYLLKLTYGLPANVFREVYTDLVRKLTAFFEKVGESLMQERWFTDVPVLVAVLLTHMQPHASTTFAAFWQQMDTVECYIAHMELIWGCIRLAPRIVETKLLVLNCCTSARKHTILTLVQAAMGACHSFMQRVTKEPQGKHEEDQFTGFRTAFMQIMRHGISVIDTLACIEPASPDLKMLLALFGQMTTAVRTPAQARFCVSLAELLLRIKHKFSRGDWTLLLRRVYKTAALGDDPKLTTELQAAYIASIVQASDWPDVLLLHNQIGIFYTNSPHVPSGQCILQLLEKSRNVFKPLLEPQQRRQIHWWEVQQFLKYHRTDTQLQESLLQSSQCTYDEVLVACVGKLQPFVAARLEAIVKSLRLKAGTGGLTRLEQLTLAHACTALLYDQLSVQKKSLAVEIKCQEDNLEDLLQRKELAAVSVRNEVRLVKLAEEALQAFAEFYNKADSEHISGDDARIDWERIVDDLASMALYLQLIGYVTLASQAWLLHYRVAKTIEDTDNALRSFSYFCEHADYFDHSTQLNLEQEVDSQQPLLLRAMEQLPTLRKRNQNYVLTCVCQLAYFYARRGNFAYAQILLQLVQLKHSALPEQQGKYNVVLGTMDVVKFRILWKQLGASRSQDHIHTELVQRCLLREVEQTLERFRTEVFKVTSSEVMPYTILLLSLVQEVAECAANRLCDYFVNAYFAGIFNILLQSGSALRIIQLLSMWAWVNLQMEFVNKAQIKVKLIECIMGVKGLADLRQLSEEAAALKKPAMTPLPTLETLHPGMEIMRKVVQVPLSPVKIDRTQLNLVTPGQGLKRFLQCHKNEALQDYEVLQWNYFIAGCLSARSHFLAENYEQLEDFYEQCQQWLSGRKDKFLQITFQNIKLLSMQHYVNYLRLRQKYDKAMLCLESALSDCQQMEGTVDCVYRVNFQLQLRATKIEVLRAQKQQAEQLQLRRALTFNESPEETRLAVAAKVVATSAMLGGGAKKKTKQAFSIFNSEADERRQKHKAVTVDVSARKAHTKAGSASDSSPPESEVEAALNRGQRVLSVDLVDSDDAEQATVPSVTKPVKTRERVCSVKKPLAKALVKNSGSRALVCAEKLQRNAVICLSDSDEEDTVSAVLGTVKKKPAPASNVQIQHSTHRSDSGEAQPSKAVHFAARMQTTMRSTSDCSLVKNTDTKNAPLESGDSAAGATVDTEVINTPKAAAVAQQSSELDNNSVIATPATTKTSTGTNTRSTKKQTASSKQCKNATAAELNTEQPTSATKVTNAKSKATLAPNLEIEITKTTTTTATKTRSKTEIRTLTLIRKETAVRLVSPGQVPTAKRNQRKEDEQDAPKSTTAKTRTTRARKVQVQNDENMQPAAASLTVNSAANRRRRQ